MHYFLGRGKRQATVNRKYVNQDFDPDELYIPGPSRKRGAAKGDDAAGVKKKK